MCRHTSNKTLCSIPPSTYRAKIRARTRFRLHLCRKTQAEILRLCFLTGWTPGPPPPRHRPASSSSSPHRNDKSNDSRQKQEPDSANDDKVFFTALERRCGLGFDHGVDAYTSRVLRDKFRDAVAGVFRRWAVGRGLVVARGGGRGEAEEFLRLGMGATGRDEGGGEGWIWDAAAAREVLRDEQSAERWMEEEEGGTAREEGGGGRSKETAAARRERKMVKRGVATTPGAAGGCGKGFVIDPMIQKSGTDADAEDGAGHSGELDGGDGNADRFEPEVRRLVEQWNRGMKLHL